MPKKRKDGRYRKSFSYNGKSYSVYATCVKDLNLKMQEKLNELSSKKEMHDNPTFDEYYKLFTDFRRGRVRETTINTQRKGAKRIAALNILGTRFGDLRMQDITQRDAKQVQQLLYDSGDLNPSSINVYIKHISHVFNDAVKDKTITENPFKCLTKLEMTSEKATDTIHRALDEDEVKLFLHLAKDSFYLNGFKMMLCTGIRVGELSALRASDFDFKRNILTINKTVTRTETGSNIIGLTPKTDCSNRSIPINATTKAIFEDQLRLVCSTFGLQHKYLFPSSTGVLLTDRTFNRAIASIVKDSPIRKFTSHAFRDTFATRFVEQHPELKNVQVLKKLMGHSDIKITFDIYVHVIERIKGNELDNFVVVI